MDGQHTFLQGPWHYCGRCDEKTKIREMIWQNSVLLCPTCVDKFMASPGVRERIISQVLSDGKEEFQIDPKLLDPANNVDADDEDPNIANI
jgi:hypothetical protein